MINGICTAGNVFSLAIQFKCKEEDIIIQKFTYKEVEFVCYNNYAIMQQDEKLHDNQTGVKHMEDEFIVDVLYPKSKEQEFLEDKEMWANKTGKWKYHAKEYANWNKVYEPSENQNVKQLFDFD